jgi:FKBP-type peptidyl-prolyl cis-trans isomerase FklB
VNKIILFCAIVVFSTSTALAETLKTKEDKLGYSIGLNLSSGLQDLLNEVKINKQMIIKGFEDGLLGNDPSITPKEFRKVMTDLQSEMKAKQSKLQEERMKKQAELGKINMDEGKAFLAKNGKRKGVKTTKSGLQYEVLKAGTGASPKATDEVETHYKGTLIDGTVFDSSYKRGKPVSFPLNKVIPGWTEALQLMKTGGKSKIYVPSDLGYGPQGPPKIGPNATLIFEIELLSIK